MDITSWNIEFWQKNINGCKEVLSKPEEQMKVPIFNHMSDTAVYKDKFVKFYGMIQDMKDPEIFFSEYEVINLNTNLKTIHSGLYQHCCELNDDEQLLEDSPNSKRSTRHSWWCTKVSSLNQWAFEKYVEQHSNSLNQGEEMDTSSIDNETQPPAKRVCISGPDCTIDPLNTGCFIKIYAEDVGEYKLNEEIEVYGFLSFIPDVGVDMFDNSQAIDNRLKPCIHAVTHRRLPHLNPLLHHPSFSANNLLSYYANIRDHLLLMLSTAFLGDCLAAEYFLCSLIASVYVQSEDIALGKISLNITNIPNNLDFPKRIYDIVTLLVTKSWYIPLSLERLNSDVFIPKKDYVKERLASGVLQQPRHTYFVVDETVMHSGQLNSQGVQNVSALKSLLLFQKVNYDFKYFTLEFSMNNPVLVVSEAKSLLPCSIIVNLQPDDTILQHYDETYETLKQQFFKGEMLDKVRCYLTLTQLAEYAVPGDVAEVIEGELVKLIHSGYKKDELDTVLVLARLLALSNGHSALTLQTFQKAIKMETERRQRV